MQKSRSDTSQQQLDATAQAYLADFLKDSPFADSPTIRRIFQSRGITHDDELDTSLGKLHPAHLLKGLDTAITLIDHAIDEQRSILVVGDFDADGATSTALMLRVLREMGAVVNYLVPDRFKYGYGLTPAIVDLGLSRYQPDLVITVDNGISSHEGVAHAQALGMQVIITDHHLTSKPKPPAEAVVNPNQLGCDFPSKALAGVGVAFYLLASLAKQRRLAGKSSTQVTRYLDLVALGTVADVSVLDANNRILVSHGLQQINARQCIVGLLALLEQAGKVTKQLTSQDLGFILGPRINAAGRMDSMEIGIECLLCDDLAQAREMAKTLETLNQQRRQVEGDIRTQALAMLDTLDTTSIRSDKKSIVLYEPSWHQGVVGIVAGRLKEQFYRPTIVFAPSDERATTLKGSARSIPGIHIRDAIERVANDYPDLISHFGGHAMAAGLTLIPEHIDAFTAAFEQVIAVHDSQVFTPSQFSDGEPLTSEYTLDFAQYLRQLAPWGNGFPAPVFTSEFDVSGVKVLKEKHLKLWLKHPNQMGVLDAIWFHFNQKKHQTSPPETDQKGDQNSNPNNNKGVSSDLISDRGSNSDEWYHHASKIRLSFELNINEYNQQQHLQLIVRDGWCIA